MTTTKQKIVKLNTFKNGINSCISNDLATFKFAKNCYNFNFSSGVLKQSFGAKLASVLNANYPLNSQEKFLTMVIPGMILPKQVHYYSFCDPNLNNEKNDKLVVISSDYKIYQIDAKSQLPFFDDNYSTMQIASLPKNVINFNLNGKDVLLMCFENDHMHIYDASKPANARLTEVYSAPKMVSLCSEFNRLFAIVSGQEGKIWFSDKKDPTLWDQSLSDAGYLTIPSGYGALKKLVNFENCVYAFCEYAIFKISAYADQTAFKASNVFACGSKILDKTIAISGDKLIFMCEDGLYSFNGQNATKILLDIENMFNCDKFNEFNAIECKGKYYLSCCLNFEDEATFGCETYSLPFKNNAIVCIDLKTSTLLINRGLDVCFMNVFKHSDATKVLCCSNNFYGSEVFEIEEDLGENFYLPVKKFWQSGFCDFDQPGKTKVIKEVMFKSLYDAKLIVETNKEKFEIKLYASSNLQKIKLNLKGEIFKVAFESLNKFACIEDVCFLVEILEK